jgi:hypothetical protein
MYPEERSTLSEAVVIDGCVSAGDTGLGSRGPEGALFIAPPPLLELSSPAPIR